MVVKEFGQLLSDQSGLDAILKEMKRIPADVMKGRDGNESRIRELAAAIQEKRNVLLLGMGASHMVNYIMALQLRRMGYEALAMTASEFLHTPMPIDGKVLILTSQSGGSAEVVRCLQKKLQGKEVYGLTLDGESPIGKGTKSLIMAGGIEKAYAGTRSVTLSVAMVAEVIARLGGTTEDAIDAALAFKQNDWDSMMSAVGIMSGASQVFVTGRGVFYPLSELFALGAQELSTRTIFCKETGQFRHGPMEALDSKAALVVFRQSGELGKLAESINGIQKKTGCHLIVVDCSGEAPLANSVTIRCPEGEDIIAALGCMETFQTLMICFACTKNDRAGLPKYCSKITREE